MAGFVRRMAHGNVKWFRNILTLLVFCLLLYIYNDEECFGDDCDGDSGNSESKSSNSAPVKQETMHLMTVSCGRPNYQGIRDVKKPLDQSLTMIKSAALFAQQRLHIHVFTEEDMAPLFEGELESWPDSIKARTEYSINKIDYTQLPQDLIAEWKSWYKPCGSFRLLTPMLLGEKGVTDAAIYADSDVVFTKPIDQLWGKLKTFSPTEVMAIAPTAGHALGGSRYNENFILHDTGLFQINSGVMVMNFTRIINGQWKLSYDEQGREKPGPALGYGSELLLKYYRKYKDRAEHDQKLLNIMFHFNPEMLHQLECSWNFKNNFCIDDGNICKHAEENGAGAVHGITSAFFGDVNPTFRALYEAFLMYNWDEDLHENLMDPFRNAVQRRGSGTYCATKYKLLADPLEESIKSANL
ncbi:unnamed protein product [Oikopleura dioica]|uniref:Glucoside xylosyltransferase 1 n=1 Tax=Oikopleura dioica TaxID=34765 RepID=E4X918_OIKDI|nr:unnamed protein product [Oikopleura dioica]